MGQPGLKICRECAADRRTEASPGSEAASVAARESRGRRGVASRQNTPGVYARCVFVPLRREALGPAGADSGVGGRHVVAGGLHLLAVGVGLLVDDLEVATQLGDELLAGHRTRAAPKVAGGQHITNEGLVLLLQRGGLGADGGAVGIPVTELVINRHGCSPNES